jgi:hypothetical protein
LILPGAGLEPRVQTAECSAVSCGRHVKHVAMHVACRAYMLLLPRNYPKSASGRLP